MLDWSDPQHLLALATHRSLPEAAEALGVDRSTVSRRIGRLEKRLGARLVERSGRDLTLTQAGEDVVASARGIDGELSHLERRLFGSDAKLAGLVRLTTMSGLAQLLAPALTNFGLAHPDVVLEVNITNALEDLGNLEADVALRMTASPPEELIGKRVAAPRLATYASQKTAKGLAKRKGLVPRYALTQADMLPESLRPRTPVPSRVVLRSNSVDVIRGAVVDGDGVALLPCYVGESDPALVRVDAPLDQPFPQLWLLYPPRVRNVARVRALVDALTVALEDLQARIEGRETR